MEELMKLLLPFINTTKTYEDVLKKLASFAFYETYLITFLLRSNDLFNTFFSGIEAWGPVGRLIETVPNLSSLNFSGLAIAFFMAILTHSFQFHDRISDVIGIRRRFDQKHILIPLAEHAGSPVSKGKIATIAQNRDRLMHSTFYKYASSRQDNPLVDKHDIEHALNAWSWYWVFIEATFYFGAGAVLAFWLGSTTLGVAFVLICIVVLSLSFLQRARLPRYARVQVDAIIANADARQYVKDQFDAL